MEKGLKKNNHSVPHEVLTVKMKMNNILATGGLNEMECWELIFYFLFFFWKDLVIPRLLEIPVLIAVARDANNGKKYHILYKAWWQFQIGDNFFHKIQHGFLSSTTFLHFRYLGIIIQFSKKVYSFFSILWVCVSRFQCKLVA